MEKTNHAFTQVSQRQFPLDLLRVLACFLVIWQHAIEPYYISPDFTLSIHEDTPLIGWINSLTPIEVPLFVMISGYFILPVKMDMIHFFRRRLTRIILPFIFWSIVYILYFKVTRGDSLSQVLQNILYIPVNFSMDAGHLWFVYMLLGMYLIAPILTPWLNACSQRQLQGYLGIWAFTTLLPYIHLYIPEIWGECFWNPTPMLHHFTGFTGYFVLGYYIKRYGALSVLQALGLLIAGYLITVSIYFYRLPSVTDISDYEICWRFCSINMAMMAYAVFSLVCRIPWEGRDFVGRFITCYSLSSYAIYLGHMFFLWTFRDWWGDSLGRVYVAVPVIVVCSFLSAYIVVRILSLLPKSKYWLGNQ